MNYMLFNKYKFTLIIKLKYKHTMFNNYLKSKIKRNFSEKTRIIFLNLLIGEKLFEQ